MQIQRMIRFSQKQYCRLKLCRVLGSKWHLCWFPVWLGIKLKPLNIINLLHILRKYGLLWNALVSLFVWLLGWEHDECNIPKLTNEPYKRNAHSESEASLSDNFKLFFQIVPEHCPIRGSRLGWRFSDKQVHQVSWIFIPDVHTLIIL